MRQCEESKREKTHTLIVTAGLKAQNNLEKDAGGGDYNLRFLGAISNASAERTDYPQREGKFGIKGKEDLKNT